MIEIKEILNNSVYENTICKSKFIAYSFAVHSTKEAEDVLNTLKQKHSDSTHICYAFSLIGGIDRAFDDGEPQGTAGKPILDCIKKSSFCNTLVVVVRYFGGIKLGAGGLIRAYSGSASKVLALSGENLTIECKKLSFCVDISESRFVNKICQIQTIKKYKVNYAQIINIDIFCSIQDIENIKDKIKNILNKEIYFEVNPNVFYV